MAATTETATPCSERIYGVVAPPAQWAPAPGNKRIAIPAWGRRGLILAILAAAWEIYARALHAPLLFPTFLETLAALREAAAGELFGRLLASLRILLAGYAGGVFLALLMSTAVASSRIGGDLLETLTAMFNPLPAIALLPLSLLWFGIGTGGIVFVIMHAVLWPTALSAHGGFRSVPSTLRMVGRNYGLSGVSQILLILVPAAFPQILVGLRNGWAFGWRTLIAAELVFGVSSGSGGLGWFIYEKKNQLETASVFAGLTAVILIGILVETLFFGSIERRTVCRWGMRS